VGKERIVSHPGVVGLDVVDGDGHHRHVLLLGHPEEAGKEGQQARAAAGRALGKGREGEPRAQALPRGQARGAPALPAVAAHEDGVGEARRGAEERPARDLLLGEEGARHLREQEGDVEIGAMVRQQEHRAPRSAASHLERDAEHAQHAPRPGLCHAQGLLPRSRSQSAPQAQPGHRHCGVGRQDGEPERHPELADRFAHPLSPAGAPASRGISSAPVTSA